MPDVPIVIVVAIARNGVIGRDGALPWRISSDLKRFKQVTMGKPIVMGRKTFESIGKPLPGRDNIVITRNRDWRFDGVTVTPGLEAALVLARESAAQSGAGEIAVIGGGEIYAQTIKSARRLYVTEVDADVDGDAAFPEIDPATWREISREEPPKGPRDDYNCAFVTFERIG